ncbi:hypothetical protein WA026_003223 [Henosepilachna vigintioctopunctata]|uniref:Centrosomin N-terminal motif 1 domain-containing protein n=1 Tax=Henosepilachna vigintioctopunctata TaxID=420089 RepID=A0AAW1TJ58_9CUCU
MLFFLCSTSPSQLNEVSACPDFTFSNSLRSPEGPMRGRSVKEVEEQLAGLKRENFNLKLRIYFLEERMGANYNLDTEKIVKNNVELMVETESLKKELQEKHELLCQAVKAMDLEEEEFKKNAQAKNDEIISLRQEVEDLRLQLQEVKYENDTESSHKSYHSEPIFLSSQVLSLPESSSRIRILQERIASLENELAQEKENNASLQMILDQADIINTKYEQLRTESEKKDETIRDLNKELNTAKEKITKISDQVRELEKFKDQHITESLKLTKLLAEKSIAVEQLEDNISGLRKKYANLKSDLEKERQKFDRTKFVNDLKATEMEEELEKQRGRVIDLQKKLGSAHQELKENQNLLVPKSSKGRSIATNTDCDNVSVPNAATSLGVPKENALRDALRSRSPSKSPVKSFDFNTIYNILNPIMFSNKSQLMKQIAVLKEVLSKSEQRIIHLKAQEMKACALIKNLMEHHKTSESQIQIYKKRIAQLEKELEGVVSKPEGRGSSTLDHQKSEVNQDENECKALINELENKIKVLELTLKEKDIHVEYIEAQNLELVNSLQNKEKDMINLEQSNSTTGEELENAKEVTNKLYSKLFDEKNKEIEKLNEELRKRTNDLQAVVNNELWEKNREIEKLQIKYAQLLENKEKEMAELKKSFVSLSENLEEMKIEHEQKHFENSNLKIDISDLKLQLQLLKDKIGEVGLIPDDKLEVEIILSSLDDIKNIQKELQDVKKEREILTNKINELEIAVQPSENFIVESTHDKELGVLRRHLEMSEALRTQTVEACNLLRSQLEELAMFLDSLMKQKSVLGFLGTSQNKKLREAIDQSLDLSKSLNMSLTMNSEQSLTQLSNITALLNCSDLSNLTGIDDNNRYSLSILPEQATLTYQSHIFNVKDGKNDQEHQSFIVKSLEDQIEMLQRELKLKNNELNRLKRESRNGKDLKLSHSKPRISPSKLKNALTTRDDKHDSNLNHGQNLMLMFLKQE